MDIEWGGSTPKKRLDLLISNNNGVWHSVGAVSLLKSYGYPGRNYRLIDLLTDTLAFEIANGVKLGVQIINMGYGLLAANDVLTIHLGWIEEYVEDEILNYQLTLQENMIHGVCNGRLDLQANTISTENVATATNLYFNPYEGDKIGIYDEGEDAFKIMSFPVVTMPLTGLAANTNHDVFAYDVGGSLSLQLIPWASLTARASEILMFRGIWVLASNPSRRYIGTIRTALAGQTEDSTSRRFLWNCHNRRLKTFSALETVSSWVGVGGGWRMANGSGVVGTARSEMVFGLAEDLIRAIHVGIVRATAIGENGVGIALNNTTTNAAEILGENIPSGNIPEQTTAIYRGFPRIGYNYLQRLEFGQTTSNWIGNNNPGILRAGMTGEAFF
ncbi:hypothetical protein NC990_02920 [Funiculus sociatus GB2-M1]